MSFRGEGKWNDEREGAEGLDCWPRDWFEVLWRAVRGARSASMSNPDREWGKSITLDGRLVIIDGDMRTGLKLRRSDLRM